MSERAGGGEFVVGFLFGAIVGAAAALLLAPQAGETTRKRLQEKGIELKDRAAELSADARQRAGELQERGRIVLEEQKAKIDQAIEEGKEAAAKKREELLGNLEKEKAVA